MPPVLLPVFLTAPRAYHEFTSCLPVLRPVQQTEATNRQGGATLCSVQLCRGECALQGQTEREKRVRCAVHGGKGWRYNGIQVCSLQRAGRWVWGRPLSDPHPKCPSSQSQTARHRCSGSPGPQSRPNRPICPQRLAHAHWRVPMAFTAISGSLATASRARAVTQAVRATVYCPFFLATPPAFR